MVSIRINHKGKLERYLSFPVLAKAAMAAALLVAMFSILSYESTELDYNSYLRACDDSKLPDVDYHVDGSCTKLPTIRPAGSYFRDFDIKAGPSPKEITPSFQVGSYYADKVPYHMNGDIPNFNLMKNALKGKEGQVAIDFGANQGFYTYYLAALGMQVHAFEINTNNFKALQHGAEFNSKEVSDRVHLYPVGIGAQNARFGMSGQLYEGFLSKNEGPILGATFDCFAHHTKDHLDLSKGVAFVKLDVEGYEIAVLQGAKHSLFRNGSTIGAMIVEVGPNRWSRAGVDFDTGLTAMKDLASHFKKSYLLVRSSKAGYEKTCPITLAQNLKDQAKREYHGAFLHQVKMDEWKDLLKTMETSGFDCNFFYQN